MPTRTRTRLRRRKREVFIAPPLKNVVIEPLPVALSDLLLAARVVTVQMCVSGEHAQQMKPRRPFGAHLTTAIVIVSLFYVVCAFPYILPLFCTHLLPSQPLNRCHVHVHTDTTL